MVELQEVRKQEWNWESALARITVESEIVCPEKGLGGSLGIVSSVSNHVCFFKCLKTSNYNLLLLLLFFEIS